MDFSIPARDAMPSFLLVPASSAAIPGGYFAAQALRAGYLDIAGDVRRAEMAGGGAAAARELLEKELLKERIRGEIILREVARLQLLQEDVRRKLEAERAMAVRRHRMELVSSFGGGFEASREMVLVNPFASEVGFDKAVVVPSVGEDRFVKKQKLFGGSVAGDDFPANLPLVEHEKKSAVSAFSPNAKPSNARRGGIKRGASELSGIAKKAGGPAEKNWSCTLCRVRTTSREDLNEHLRGKKHKANAELMGIMKNVRESTSAKGADRPLTVTKATKLKASHSNLKGKHPLTKAVGQHPPQKQQNATRLYCQLCKVECTSDSMLASHLRGKKHTTMLENVPVSNSR